MSALRRSAGWVAVAIAVAWATHLRAKIIASGPDPDIDAYAHFVLARRLPTEWRDTRVHWVWLPLWQYVGCAASSVWGSITALRWFSVVCSALTSFALTATLRAGVTEREAPRSWVARAEAVIPFGAGALFALWPLNLAIGASAEPEALFQLLVVLAAWAWQTRAYVSAGVALSLVALLRYEAWPLLPVFAALWGTRERSGRAAIAWVMPGIAVALWCALDAWSTGAPLHSLRENSAYVADAWREFRFESRALPKLEHPWRWYAWTVPWYSLKGWMPWVVVGAPWFAWRGSRALVASSAVLLALVTGVWITRGNLGLERHFAGLVPAYAAMAVAGVAMTVAWLSSRTRIDVTRTVAVALVLAGAYFTATRVARWDAMLCKRGRDAFVSERRVAAMLRARARPGARVFTDVKVVEVLSELPARNFVRWDVTDVKDFNVLVECAHHGEAWVASAPSRVTQLHDELTEVYRDGELVLLRRRAPAVLDPALMRERSVP